MKTVVLSLENEYSIDVLYTYGVLSKRVWAALKTNSDVRFLTDLQTMRCREIKDIKGIGKKCYKEIKSLCNFRGIYFNDDIDGYPANVINHILSLTDFDGEKIEAKPGYEDRFFNALDTLLKRDKFIIEAIYRDGLLYKDLTEFLENSPLIYPMTKAGSGAIMHYHYSSIRNLRRQECLKYILYNEPWGPKKEEITNVIRKKRMQ